MNLCFIQIQCNVFPGASGEVSLTAAGGLRKIGLGDTYESPSLVQFVILRFPNLTWSILLLHTYVLWACIHETELVRERGDIAQGRS
jgi:hypothetical protein